MNQILEKFQICHHGDDIILLYFKFRLGIRRVIQVSLNQIISVFYYQEVILVSHLQ